MKSIVIKKKITILHLRKTEKKNKYLNKNNQWNKNKFKNKKKTNNCKKRMALDHQIYNLEQYYSIFK